MQNSYREKTGKMELNLTAADYCLALTKGGPTTFQMC